MQTANIRELLEKWARWRDARNKFVGRELGYGENMSGRLLDGIKRKECTCVKGERYVKVNNNYFWMQCGRCNGLGYISAWGTGGKISPKLIRSTGGIYPDDTSLRIDRLVCQLPRMGKRVILQEYDWNGTQDMKAERLRISYENYKVILHRSHAAIEKGLTLPVTLPQNLARVVI